jgi:hypothetical protein
MAQVTIMEDDQKLTSLITADAAAEARVKHRR